MSLDDLRRRIDTLDDRILDLLKERASLVEQVAISKRESGSVGYHDPKREQEILARLSARGAGSFPPEAIRSVYREIMSACLSLQQAVSVAFLGPEGTFTQMAARQLFGLAARYREAPTIEGVFDAVQRRDATYGVVPFENSTEGSVTPTLDALLESPLRIRQELVLPVVHCLLSRAPGLTSVERVYSIPQALAQCRLWVAKQLSGIQVIQTPSTAAAARNAVDDPSSAAIGSRLAGDLYGLGILCEGIQDRQGNATRFVVLGETDSPASGNDKTTIAFYLQDRPGALKQVLATFEDGGINLSRIESRPSHRKAWDYMFVCDFDGHRTDAAVVQVLDNLGKRCEEVHILGSYPHAL